MFYGDDHVLTITAVFLFALSAGLIFLRYFLSYRIATYLIKQDCMYHGAIIPHKFGCVSRTICILPAIISAALAAIQHENLIVIAIIIIPYSCLAVAKYNEVQTRTVFVQSDNLVITRRGESQNIPFSSIQSVSWKPTDMRFCNCLEIRINEDVVLEFAQDDYWGLNDMHSLLSRAIKKR